MPYGYFVANMIGSDACKTKKHSTSTKEKQQKFI